MRGCMREFSTDERKHDTDARSAQGGYGLIVLPCRCNARHKMDSSQHTRNGHRHETLTDVKKSGGMA